jgi:hypothetical protein
MRNLFIRGNAAPFLQNSMTPEQETALKPVLPQHYRLGITVLKNNRNYAGCSNRSSEVAQLSNDGGLIVLDKWQHTMPFDAKGAS